MACFILIHGAMHGRWCWEKLQPELEALGHRVIAPDLPGVGDDHSIPIGEIRLAHWAHFVAELACAAPEPPILVGHSRGGLVIGEAAERVPDHLAGLIYLSAIIVPHGQTTGEAMAAFDGPVAPRSDDGISLRFEPAAAIPFFYHRCDPALAEQAAAQLCSEPIAPLAARSTISEGRWGRVPRAYVECLDDRAITIAAQRAMQAAAPCDPVITLDTDHSPFLGAPTETARALDEIAADFARQRKAR